METKDMHEMKDNGDILKLDPAPQHRISSSPCTSSSSVLSHSSPRHHIMIGSDLVNQEILSLLSRWNGLQMAIKNSWGGCDSQHKYDQLIEDVISMFARSEGWQHADCARMTWRTSCTRAFYFLSIQKLRTVVLRRLQSN